MEYGCALCNGMISIQQRCPQCGRVLEDKGQLENYFGPYSPYEDTDHYQKPLQQGNVSVAPCIHLFSCAVCGYDVKLGFYKVIM